MTLGENIARLRTQMHRRRHPSGKSAIPSPEQLYCVPVRSFWFSGCCSPVIC